MHDWADAVYTSGIPLLLGLYALLAGHGVIHGRKAKTDAEQAQQERMRMLLRKLGPALVLIGVILFLICAAK